MINKMKLFKHIGMSLIFSFSATVAFAGSIASEQVDSGGLTLLPKVSYDTAGLRVSSDSSDVTSSFEAGDSIRVDAGGLADGVYYYELALSTNPSAESQNGSSVTQNGDFIVSGGVASSHSHEEQEAKAQAEMEAAVALQVNEGDPK